MPPADSEAATGSWKRGLVLFAVALVLRSIFLLEARDSTLFSVLLGDAALYDAWARELAAGNWWGDEVFYQAPLYPYFMGVVYRILGPDPFWVRCVQVVLGSASCALVAGAAARLLAPRVGMRGGVLVGWATGLLLALHAPSIWLDGSIQKASLGLFLGALLLAAVVPGSRRIDSPRAVAAGVLLGLLVLTRENAGILALVLAAWLLWGPFRAEAKGRVRSIALLAAGLVLVLLPVGIRNRAVGGEFLPTSFNAGVNFYIGNGAEADGLYVPLLPGRGHPDYESADAVRLAEEGAGRELSPLEVSRHWFGKALSDVGEDPGRWARLLLRKTLLLLNHGEMMDADSLEACREESRLLDALAPVFGFGLLAALGAAGVWLGRRSWRETWILLAAVLALGASIVAFFVTARFRMGLVPFVAPLAGLGLVELARLLRSRELRAARPGVVLALATALIAYWPAGRWPLLLPGDALATTHSQISDALLREDRVEEAVAFARRALERAPDDADVLYNLGLALAANDELEEAETHLGRSAEIEPLYRADVEAALGLIDGMCGDPRAAAEHFRRSLELGPDDAGTRFNLGLALRESGELDEAAEQYEHALRLEPDHLDALNNLAHLLDLQGSSAEAWVLQRHALAVDGDFLPSLLWLAWYSATHPDASRRDAAEAVRLAERASQLTGGDDLETLEVLAAAYAEAGRFPEARGTARRAARLAREAGLEELAAELARRVELYESEETFRAGR